MCTVRLVTDGQVPSYSTPLHGTSFHCTPQNGTPAKDRPPPKITPQELHPPKNDTPQEQQPRTTKDGTPPTPAKDGTPLWTEWLTDPSENSTLPLNFVWGRSQEFYVTVIVPPNGNQWRMCPPLPIFSFLCSFQQKLCQIIGYHPVCDWCLPSGKSQDPILVTLFVHCCKWRLGIYEGATFANVIVVDLGGILGAAPRGTHLIYVDYKIPDISWWIKNCHLVNSKFIKDMIADCYFLRNPTEYTAELVFIWCDKQECYML